MRRRRSGFAYLYVCRFGNKFYENLDEQPGRHRWVDYVSHDYNTVQLEPTWHSWLHQIRQDPPNKDPIVEANHQTWMDVSVAASRACVV